ncbi:MAG TPA: HAD-IC family P-type ATPase, partial [Thermoplasmata archaeon]
MATDPVCGMYVDERSATLTLFRDNRTYYFCSSTCREQFAAPAERIRDLRRTLLVAWPLAVLALVASYLLPGPGAPYVAFGAAAVVQFYAGWPFYRGSLDAIRARVGNMDLLIAVGTSAAFGYSASALFLPGRLPPQYYFDASALIIALILTGNYLEHLTRHRATGAVRKLRELLPDSARVLRDGREIEIPVVELRVGDRVRLRPGERIPVDGVVRSGRTSVEESLLTGESLPVSKEPGAKLLAGSINGVGAVEFEATGVGEDTFLAQVAQLMSEAEMSHVPLQRLADRIAAAFVPVVLTLAVAAALAWYFLGAAGPTIAVLVFVSVVITACPCAFGIATPAAIVVGIGRAAEEGVLFKGSDSLERAARADLVLTDKTGTLTEGRVTLSEVVPAAGVPESRVLSLAAAVESGSEHPMARAVLGRAASLAGGFPEA